jgi:hypothetical protein
MTYFLFHSYDIKERPTNPNKSSLIESCRMNLFQYVRLLAHPHPALLL